MGINSAIAAKIAAAKPNMAGNIIRPGDYLFEVIRMIYMPQGTGAGCAFNGEMFVIELGVLESSATGELGRDGKAVVPNAVNTVASLVINLTKSLNGGGDIKAFLMALLGESEEAISSAVIASSVSDEQPFQFLRIRDQAWSKPQRSNPAKDFTRHRWTTVALTDAELASIAQRRAEAVAKAKLSAPAK